MWVSSHGWDNPLDKNGNSLCYCLENIMDRGICQESTESDVTEYTHSKT